MDKTEKAIKTVEVMTTILQNNDEVNKYLEKAKLSLKDEQKDLVIQVMGMLSSGTDEGSPIANILDVVVDILDDGKIKLTEMPKLMNVLVKNIKAIDIKEVNNEDHAVILKIVVFILDETKVIKIDDDELDLIMDSIDTAVFLFEQLDEIKIDIVNDKDSNKDSNKDSDDDSNNKDDNKDSEKNNDKDSEKNDDKDSVKNSNDNVVANNSDDEDDRTCNLCCFRLRF